MSILSEGNKSFKRPTGCYKSSKRSNVKGLAHKGAQVLKMLIRSCFVAIGSMLVGVCIQGKPQEHPYQYRGDHSCGIAR